MNEALFIAATSEKDLDWWRETNRLSPNSVLPNNGGFNKFDHTSTSPLPLTVIQAFQSLVIISVPNLAVIARKAMFLRESQARVPGSWPQRASC